MARDKKFAVFTDFVQTSKIFILEIIYMHDISWSDLWLILCSRSLSNYAPSVMALLKSSSCIPESTCEKRKYSNSYNDFIYKIRWSGCIPLRRGFHIQVVRYSLQSFPLRLLMQQMHEEVKTIVTSHIVEQKKSRILSCACTWKVNVPSPSKMISNCKSMIFFSVHGLLSIFSGLLKSNLQGSYSSITVLYYSGSDTHIPSIQFLQILYYHSFSRER